MAQGRSTKNMSTITRIRTSRLSIKNSLSRCVAARDRVELTRNDFTVEYLAGVPLPSFWVVRGREGAGEFDSL